MPTRPPLDAFLTKQPLAPARPPLTSFMAAAPTAQPQDFLGKAGNFIAKHNLPGASLGEALGTSLAAGKALLTGDTEGYNFIAQNNAPDFKRTIGDTVRIGAIPATIAAPGASTALGTVGQFGTAGAVQSGAESLSEGNTFKQAAIDSFKGGLLGGAIGGAVAGTGKVVSKVANRAPEALYNNSLRVLQRVKQAGKSPSEFLADKGVWGSLGSIRKAAEEGIEAEGKLIAPKLAAAKGGGTWQQIKTDAVNQLSKEMGELYSRKEIAAMIEGVPVASLKKTKGALSWTAFDKVRQQLGKQIGDTRWLSTATTEKQKAAKAVYRAMASTLQKNTGTAEEFARQSKWIQTKTVTDRAIGLADSKYGLGLYDFISGGSGAAIGGLSSEGGVTERLKNAAIGGAIGVGIERSVNSPAIKTGLAQIIKKLDSIPVDGVGRVSKQAVIELIAQLVGTKK